MMSSKYAGGGGRFWAGRSPRNLFEFMRLRVTYEFMTLHFIDPQLISSSDGTDISMPGASYNSEGL